MRAPDSDRGVRVLLVEDDPLTREVLSAALAGSGFEVHAEPDGSRVERAAATFRPDIALIDMRLGDGVDGITVARRLKGTDDFPLLFLTSASAIEDVLAAYDDRPHRRDGRGRGSADHPLRAEPAQSGVPEPHRQRLQARRGRSPDAGRRVRRSRGRCLAAVGLR